MTTIYEKIMKAGIEFSSHESDLYVLKTPESEKIISGYKFKSIVSVFYGTDKRMWYDIPFAYDPYWQKKYI